jgi:hypothetical protein
LAVAAKTGAIKLGDHVGMFGIGSGINSVMVAAEWGETAITGCDDLPPFAYESPAISEPKSSNQISSPIVTTT